MELRQLERFLVLSEELNFTRAAEMLHVVQSALTKSIQDLESELGTPLLIRSTHRVELTEAGRAFLAEIRRTMDSLRSAREAVSSVKGLLRGTLTLGIMNRFVSRVNLPMILGQFRSKYPGVDIRLLQGGSSELMTQVHAGKLDLAVLGVTEPPPFSVVTTMLAREDLLIAMPPKHPLSTRRRISLAELKDEDFVDVHSGRALRTTVDRAFAAAHVHHRTVCDVSDISTLLDLVSHGVGIALVPESATAYQVAIAYVPAKPPAPKWNVAVAHQGEQPANPAARVFRESLIEHAAALERNSKTKRTARRAPASE